MAFEKGSSNLPEGTKTAIRKFIEGAVPQGRINEVHVADRPASATGICLRISRSLWSRLVYNDEYRAKASALMEEDRVVKPIQAKGGPSVAVLVVEPEKLTTSE